MNALLSGKPAVQPARCPSSLALQRGDPGGEQAHRAARQGADRRGRQVGGCCCCCVNTELLGTFPVASVLPVAPVLPVLIIPSLFGGLCAGWGRQLHMCAHATAAHALSVEHSMRSMYGCPVWACSHSKPSLASWPGLARPISGSNCHCCLLPGLPGTCTLPKQAGLGSITAHALLPEKTSCWPEGEQPAGAHCLRACHNRSHPSLPCCASQRGRLG